MITCPICDYHYHENRTHCPTCGCIKLSIGNWVYSDENERSYLVVAKGAERARQLPQSPRFFHKREFGW